MAEKGDATPTRSAWRKWIGRIAIGVLLMGVLALGTWFGLGQPHLWQALVVAPPNSTLVESVAPNEATPPAGMEEIAPSESSSVSSAISSTIPLTSPVTVGFDVQPVATGSSTFTSREVVTTTLAVPLDEWEGRAAQTVALSADGRWVAFTAENASGDDELYLYDRQDGVLTPVTVAFDGSSSNGWVGAPGMVPDGRYLAFYAWASNLVEGDTNAVQDLFFYSRDEEKISRISMAASGGQANDRSGDSSGNVAPALSADGQLIAFDSAASNLTPGDGNGRVDVFVHDRSTMSTALISQGVNGVAGNGDSSQPAISVDGRFVLFQSRATNLDPSVPTLASPGTTQIYLHDRNDGSNRLISRGPDGRPGDDASTSPAISGDGRYLVYASAATNLVAGDSNKVADIFLHDRITGETRRISVSSAGIQANRSAWSPKITLDGRHILFGAEASNLVNGDGNQAADLFVYDQMARHTSRVSVGVNGTWRGIEANGPTRGPAAIIPGGRLIAFVSQARNLAEGSGVPALYLHERVDAPTFTLAGQVTESGGQPVAGVTVVAGPHRTTTDNNGSFRLSTLVGGTYTLATAKAGYTFTPPRRTISLLSNLEAQDFLAFAGGGPDSFLDLPISYDGSAATLMALLRDTDEGGLIDAWFDHDAPNYTKNQSMVLWDGRRRTQELYNERLGCYERRCYEGHDGIDFPYRDPNPGTPNIFEPILVRPAAAGLIAGLVQNCADSDRWCNGGYGNEMILWHDNGYFTRYGHLASLATAERGQWLTPNMTLGEMGSTGNSFGTHLHFAVHQDNGNGVWDGEKVDLPVDPFGWAGIEADPWATHVGGAVSRWLWRFNASTEAILLGSEGATLRDGAGSVTVHIPAGALAGQVRVELVTGAAIAPPAGSQRTLGRAFRLQVLDWLQGGNSPNATPARPVEISVGFAGAATRHLDIDQLLLYEWKAGVGWSPLPTVVDQQAQAVIAATNHFGDFDLQAPLLCPADEAEPDDSFDAALFAVGATATWERLFDIAEDEDWFQVEAVAGANYQVTSEASAPGVEFTIELYDHDGLTPLDAQRGPGTLSWTAAEAGSYFVRVAPNAGSNLGCEAGYRLTITGPESASLPSN